MDRNDTSPGRTVDWIVSLLLVLAGSASAVGGYLLYGAADRDRIRTGVDEGWITSDVLADAELIDVTYALAWGGGIGLAATGALLVATGAWFAVARRRSRRRSGASGIAAQSTATSAVVGATVTVAASFVPLSPVLGGGVAAYLRRDSGGTGIRTGALAGLFAVVPVVVLFAVVVGSLVVGAPSLTPLVLVVLALALATSVVYAVGLSALGGYLGTRLGAPRGRSSP